MDVLKAVQTYVIKMITEVPGMKVLSLDAHTTPIVSLVTTQTESLAHEVYLTDRIDNVSRESSSHSNCVAFLSPTEQSVQWVKQESQKPKYGGYWSFFSNVLTKGQIEEMASVDEFEVVKEVQEYFADYSAQYPSSFTLTPAALDDGGAGPSNPPIYLPSPDNIPDPVSETHQRAISACSSSLKKRPVIRWERMSAAGRKLAQSSHNAIQTPPYRDSFEFRTNAGPAPSLSILDRRNDPVTPSLSQWTYEAMVHESSGIVNGRVHVPGEEKSESRDLVSSASSDPFFSAHSFENFGDLGASLSQYVTDYSAKTSSMGAAGQAANRIDTIADMKRFVEEYPEFKRSGGNVSKHVALVGELSRVIERDDSLNISEVEQSLASQESHAADSRSVQQLIASPKTPAANKLRLAISYASRYQKFAGNAIASVVDASLAAGVPAERARLVYVMLNIAGADERQDDSFMNENSFSRGKSASKGSKGVENVYTQHTPHLAETLDSLSKGRSRESSYPFVEGGEAARTQRPQDIILFILGGATYEESRTVASSNQRSAGDAGGPGGTRILLGGSCVHNSESFSDMIANAATTWPETVYQPPPNLGVPSSHNSLASTPTPAAGGVAAPAPGGPSINLRAGGYELSVGGAGGTGLFRSRDNDVNLQLQGIAQVGEGIRDGAGRSWGNVRQRMEERVNRVGTPPV